MNDKETKRLEMIFNAYSDDDNVLLYRKALNPISGGGMSTLLLSQIMYWYKKSNGEFYKFIEPCNHPLYKAGDSWCEELGVSRSTIVTGLRNFAFKLGKKNKDKYGDKYDDMVSNAVVTYYTDKNRMTRYTVNKAAFAASLEKVTYLTEEHDVTVSSKHDVTVSSKHDVTLTETTLTKNTTNTMSLQEKPEETACDSNSSKSKASSTAKEKEKSSAKKKKNPPPKDEQAAQQSKDALILSKFLLARVSKATGRTLTSKPLGKPIVQLLKAGFTPKQVQDTIIWLSKHYEQGTEFIPVVQSSTALHQKWDKIQSAMEREGKSPDKQVEEKTTWNKYKRKVPAIQVAEDKTTWSKTK